MTEQTVIIAGGTGVLGREIGRVLAGAGYRVLGLGRGAGNDIRADITDRDALLRALSGVSADIVVHAATALARTPVRHRDFTPTDVLRTVGMRNLVDGYRTVGASLMVTESMMFGYGYRDHGRAPVTEEAPFAPAERDPRLEEHVAAMRVKESLTRDVGGVSLRYGLFYGPGASDGEIAMLRGRRLPAPDTGDRVVSWVHVADAAEAVLAAIRHGKPGEAYNIADDTPIGFAAHIRALATAFGTPKPIPVPVWLLRPVSLMYAIMKTNLRLSHARATAELGWEPRYPSTADGLATMSAAAVAR